jgi:serine/threonine protein kinase
MCACVCPRTQEWVPGGELFHHLDIEGSFSDAAACFYAANVLLALECLHARDIVYRDLKPENLLLDTKVCVNSWSCSCLYISQKHIYIKHIYKYTYICVFLCCASGRQECQIWSLSRCQACKMPTGRLAVFVGRARVLVFL